jgi:hypothetical protein
VLWGIHPSTTLIGSNGQKRKFSVTLSHNFDRQLYEYSGFHSISSFLRMRGFYPSPGSINISGITDFSESRNQSGFTRFSECEFWRISAQFCQIVTALPVLLTLAPLALATHWKIPT